MGTFIAVSVGAIFRMYTDAVTSTDAKGGPGAFMIGVGIESGVAAFCTTVKLSGANTIDSNAATPPR